VPVSPGADRPLVLKIPEWQTATLFVVAAFSLFLAIYLPIGAFPKLLAGAAGFFLALGGLTAARAYLVADDEGIGTRSLLRERSITWDDLDDIKVVSHHGALTLRIVRHDKSGFDVRPALVLPLRPATTPTTAARLEELARKLKQHAPIA
jgi:hypothetical protein